jgi:hypothetical protein
MGPDSGGNNRAGIRIAENREKTYLIFYGAPWLVE